MHGGSHGNENCDAACQKIILDFVMAVVAAAFYQRVIARIAGFADADYEVPQLFIDAQLAFRETALWMNENRKMLTENEYVRLTAIVDDNCYRATKYLIPWATKPTVTPELAAAWTAVILGWIKSDQEFFVPLLQKLRDGKEHE